jgi:hypothetical protein
MTLETTPQGCCATVTSIRDRLLGALNSEFFNRRVYDDGGKAVLASFLRCCTRKSFACSLGGNSAGAEDRKRKQATVGIRDPGRASSGGDDVRCGSVTAVTPSDWSGDWASDLERGGDPRVAAGACAWVAVTAVLAAAPLLAAVRWSHGERCAAVPEEGPLEPGPSDGGRPGMEARWSTSSTAGTRAWRKERAGWAAGKMQAAACSLASVRTACPVARGQRTAADEEGGLRAEVDGRRRQPAHVGVEPATKIDRCGARTPELRKLIDHFPTQTHKLPPPRDFGDYRGQFRALIANGIRDFPGRRDDYAFLKALYRVY